ncbi:MAG: hypothetical protein WCA83_00525 [Azonexus sp.]
MKLRNVPELEPWRAHMTSRNLCGESALWKRSFAFASGEFASLWVWVAILPYVQSGHGNVGKGNSLDWAFLFFVLVSLFGALGFRIGLIGFEACGDSGWEKRHFWLAFGIGAMFPLSFFVLRPVFGLVSTGILPGIVWMFIGAMVAAVLYRRLVVARK